MTQRATKQGKRPAPRREPVAREPASTPGAAEARFAALVAERDAALAELARAKAQIAALEASRAQVVDRIDWIMDSLKSIVEAER